MAELPANDFSELTDYDLSKQGTGGYGTYDYVPGTAGDLAAEAATAGIVTAEQSAELAAQQPNIVVPINIDSSDGDSGNDYNPYTYTGEFNEGDEGTIFADDRTGVTSQIDLGDISRMVSKPTNSEAMNRAIKTALGTGTGGLLTLPLFLNDLYQKREAAQRQAIVDEAETARLADTPENAGYATESDKIMAEGDIAFGDTRVGTGTQDYDEYSDTPTYSTPAPAYSYEGSDEQDEASNYASEPESTYQGSPAYSGSDDSSNDSSPSSSDSYNDGYWAEGGIVRLRKNKQNNRIQERRKRLSMGGITSLYG